MDYMALWTGFLQAQLGAMASCSHLTTTNDEKPDENTNVIHDERKRET